MYAEIQERVGLHTIAHTEIQRQVFIVIHLTALYLHDLCSYLSGQEEVTQSLYERCAVDIHLRAVGVAVVGE